MAAAKVRNWVAISTRCANTTPKTNGPMITKAKSIRFRIIASGMAITAVVAALGLLGDVMLTRVSTEVGTLSQQALPTVLHRTGLERAAIVNRNNALALATRMDEKSNRGDSVLASAQTADNDAWKVAGDNGAAVNRRVATAKTSNRIALAAGLFVSLAVILYLLRSIEICVTRPIHAVAATVATAKVQMVAAASQVSAASKSLADRASEQAASLEATSSALEEMSSRTKRHAENAQQAKHLAETTTSAAEAAHQGVQVMSQSMDAIQAASAELRQALGAVQDSHHEVAKIIETIDELAFLALNAAVEAVDAGEAGMGSTVVTDKVRHLAHKSAAAARETRSTIAAAIGRTELGVRFSAKVVEDLKTVLGQARQVESSLKGMEPKSQAVAGLVGELAAAASEQSQGIAQVNTTLSQMDRVIQSNAASAEELNAHAEALSAMVSELQQLGGGAEGRGQRAQVRRSRPEIGWYFGMRESKLPQSAGKPQPSGAGGNGGHTTARSPAVPALTTTRSGNSQDIPLAADSKDVEGLAPVGQRHRHAAYTQPPHPAFAVGSVPAPGGFANRFLLPIKL